MRIRLIVILGALLGSSLGLAQTISGIVNPAAVNQTNGIAPGSLISIFGGSLAGSLASADSVVLSTTLSDVSAVTINGVAAPLVMVSDGEITAQAPWELTPGPATVQVARTNSMSNSFSLQINQFAPALFNIQLGGLQAIAVNADGSLAAPSGLLGALNSHPATAGDTLVFYATGLGPVNGGLADGALPPGSTDTTVNQPMVTIGGMPAQINWAGMSPQFFGVYQLNVVVPSGLTPGSAIPVQVQVGGTASPDPVTIAVQ
jgi:uncharacterized protein (TIGR03437 family)